jgi:UDP-N-acetylglucosamine--N-acetylmuramyl-(pentapeptide) pyrophosphoryl-undecaprenol N-acetylglucosamine transferase
MKIIIAAGGTGGSVNPALAVAEEIKKLKPRAEILFVGTKTGPEKGIVSAVGLDFAHVPSAKLRRYFSINNLCDFFKFFAGIIKSFFIIKRFQPDVIFGTGSFVQVPLCWVGKLFKAKIVIHQQDSRIGLANKLVSFIADSITTAFEYTSKEFYSGSGFMTKKWNPRALWVGNPIRASILSKQLDFKDFFGLNSDLPVLFVFGGSTGAEQINQFIFEIAPKLVKSFQVVHMAGKGKSISLFQNSNYHVFDFLPFPQYSYIMQKAHIVVSRAGLSTITELSSLRKCSIIIPMPYSHQEDNATMMQLMGAAIVLFRNHATAQNLERIIFKLNFDPDTQKALKKNIQTVNRPEAAKTLAGIIIKHSNERKKT